MKSYEEMAQSALNRIDEYHYNKRLRYQKIRKVMIPAAGCCIFLLAGLWNYIPLKEKPLLQNENQNYYTGLQHVEFNDFTTETKEFNYDSNIHRKEILNDTQMQSYIGLDFKNIKDKEYQFVEEKPFQLIFNTNNEIIYDLNSFTYRNYQKEVTVYVSRLSDSYDDLNQFQTKKPTEIKIQEKEYRVILGKKDDIHLAEFQSEDVYYQVKGKKLSDEEFYELITKIIGQGEKQ